MIQKDNNNEEIIKEDKPETKNETEEQKQENEENQEITKICR